MARLWLTLAVIGGLIMPNVFDVLLQTARRLDAVVEGTASADGAYDEESGYSTLIDARLKYGEYAADHFEGGALLVVPIDATPGMKTVADEALVTLDGETAIDTALHQASNVGGAVEAESVIIEWDGHTMTDDGAGALSSTEDFNEYSTPSAGPSTTLALTPVGDNYGSIELRGYATDLIHTLTFGTLADGVWTLMDGAVQRGTAVSATGVVTIFADKADETVLIVGKTTGGGSELHVATYPYRELSEANIAPGTFTANVTYYGSTYTLSEFGPDGDLPGWTILQATGPTPPPGSVIPQGRINHSTGEWYMPGEHDTVEVWFEKQFASGTVDYTTAEVVITLTDAYTGEVTASYQYTPPASGAYQVFIPISIAAASGTVTYDPGASGYIGQAGDVYGLLTRRYPAWLLASKLNEVLAELRDYMIETTYPVADIVNNEITITTRVVEVLGGFAAADGRGWQKLLRWSQKANTLILHGDISGYTDLLVRTVEQAPSVSVVAGEPVTETISEAYSLSWLALATAVKCVRWRLTRPGAETQLLTALLNQLMSDEVRERQKLRTWETAIKLQAPEWPMW